MEQQILEIMQLKNSQELISKTADTDKWIVDIWHYIDSEEFKCFNVHSYN